MRLVALSFVAACASSPPAPPKTTAPAPEPTLPVPIAPAEPEPVRAAEPPRPAPSPPREATRESTPPPEGGRASTCRHARADHMSVRCSSDRECVSKGVVAACANAPMTFTCKRGTCRSRRTDACAEPFEIDDPEVMRRLIVDCF